MTLVDRAEAGRTLAAELGKMGFSEPPLVLAIAPAAVPVAFEVARALQSELDILEVQSFFARGRAHRELGLVAGDGMRVVHGQVQASLGLSDEAVAEAAGAVAADIHAREHSWRRRHPRPTFGGRTVVLVADEAGDDARVDGAVLIARALGAAVVTVATPSGLRVTLEQVRADADNVVCLAEEADRASLPAAGPAPDDATVRTLLERAEEWRAPVPV